MRRERDLASSIHNHINTKPPQRPGQIHGSSLNQDTTPVLLWMEQNDGSHVSTFPARAAQCQLQSPPPLQHLPPSLPS